jgi:hypothetical protein
MRNETYELCRKDKKDVNMTVGELEAVPGKSAGRHAGIRDASEAESAMQSPT